MSHVTGAMIAAYPFTLVHFYTVNFREGRLPEVLFGDFRVSPCGWRHGPENWANKGGRDADPTR
jgi:hypothetical protein